MPTAREIAWEIADRFCDKSAGVYRLRNAIERAILADRFCDKSAGVYRLRNAIERAILAERERCAKIAEAADNDRHAVGTYQGVEIAAAIRAAKANQQDAASK